MKKIDFSFFVAHFLPKNEKFAKNENHISRPSEWACADKNKLVLALEV